jgi:putative heme iron utilization protein
MNEKAAKHARELLLKEYYGVLSTHSKAMPGFPFGSVVPYCLDAQGAPLILISRIAQHTHNLQLDPCCSLLVGERGAQDVQAAGRLTLLAQAQLLEDPAQIAAAAARYQQYFPESRDYQRTHDFDFWRLQPVRARFIGGFGAIHWLDAITRANPFAGSAEASMLEHMNADHAPALAHYVALAGLPQHEPARMVGIDGEGFHLRIGRSLHWLNFPSPCTSAGEVRQALVTLAHSETWPARA